jgi:hypothetical protein
MTWNSDNNSNSNVNIDVTGLHPEALKLPGNRNAFQFVNREGGRYLCPVCWTRFDLGDVMHIAQHESLHGDPILGSDAPLRFFASRFNDMGQALDAMGMACPDMACPHCRRKLPDAFLEMPHHIFSLVGAPGAGKSYYISVLAKVLPEALYKRFRILMKDSDPAGNARLNDMKNRLFAGGTAEQALLVKTQLEGEMYERVPHGGRFVAMPRPFVFHLSRMNGNEGKDCGLIFYDNAGEHFEPGSDNAESPGARHVANSSALFFLFDPTSSLEFRRRLKGHPDPQLAITDKIDQQYILLAELEARIKRLRRLSVRDRIDEPLAILVGKSDLWNPVLLSQPLEDPFSNGRLDHDVLVRNSERLRTLLLECNPTLVANADSLSNQVMYFPVSSLGHSPKPLKNGALAPDPEHIVPYQVEVPLIWAMEKIGMGLFG